MSQPKSVLPGDIHPLVLTCSAGNHVVCTVSLACLWNAVQKTSLCLSKAFKLPCRSASTSFLRLSQSFSIVIACTKGQICGALQQGGDAGGQAAISELIKEATLLSSMRHPNVVWVYGIVLKPMSKDEDDDDELSDRDQGDAF